MGKSAFALNIGVNVAKKYKKTVAIFNLEMSREQLAMRLLASEGFVELQKLATGKLSEDEWSKLCMASAALSQTDIRHRGGHQRQVPPLRQSGAGHH